MAKSPSPGSTPLLAAHSTCECRWQGFAFDRAGALQLWQEHAQRAGHDQATTEHTESE
jgi:hypothetical protein